MKIPFLRSIVTLALGSALLILNSCQNAAGPSSSGSSSAYADQSRPLGASANPKRSEAMHRPGLGTEAGSNLHSLVQDATFFRKSVGAPDVLDSFHYNDEEGAKAMLGGSEASVSRHHGRFEAAQGLLKVALVGTGWGNRGDEFPYLTSRSAPGRKVVVGQAGSSYGISLENTSKHRIEVVTSVDGIDVLDGQTASVKKHGYVLAPGQKMNVEGFRTNSSNVKQFLFGSVRDSAAAKKGEAAARNVGVIGLAVWQEDQLAALQAQRLEANQRTQANPFGGPVSAR